MNSTQFLKTLSQELHKRASKTFERRKVIEPNGAYNSIAMDLADMNFYKDANDGYRYILVVIDIFSRKVWVEPIKTKTAVSALEAFQKILKKMDKTPIKINADDGSEWKGIFGQFLKKNNIDLYHTYSEFHSSIVERFHRTLKDMINKYFTEHQTHRYIDNLQTFINTYNNKKHSTLKMSPNEASKPENYNLAFDNQYGKQEFISQKSDAIFKVGDFVRISRTKNKFEKEGFNWSQEIFTIADVKLTNPPTYIIKDSKGEIIKGSFYGPELQKTKLNDIFLVEKILKKRTLKGEKQVLIKWLGYDDSFNSWEPEETLINLK